MNKIHLKTIITLALSLLLQQAQGQLTLEQCYEQARENYPLLQQMALIEQTAAYSLENAAKGILPRVQLAGQATYQSDVTAIPISFPGIDIPSPNKDQYKVYGEISQSLTDHLLIKEQKTQIAANTKVETQKIEVELYQLKERINQLYFGILLIDEQLKQTVLLKQDIQEGIDQTQAAIANGVALKSSADHLRAELFKVEQGRVELKANRQAFANRLALFIDQEITENTTVERPIPQEALTSIVRPEITLFDLQEKSISGKAKSIQLQKIPRVYLFLQAGMGRPALNLLENKFSPYYIGGLRFNWNLSAFYTNKNEQQLLRLSQEGIGIQKSIFRFNNELKSTGQQSEINKYQQLLALDAEIIALRQKVKNTAKRQLEFGTITAYDFLDYIHAEDKAKQNLLLHELQLLLAKIDHETTVGINP